MKFEHFGINVPHPQAMAAWYVRHFNMKIVSSMHITPYTHFLADDSGRVIMEIYANETVDIPDYNLQHPLKFHVAFEVRNSSELAKNLIKDGALFFEEVKTDDGSSLIMLRDPWGVPIQLCQRGKPII
jgi:catechol 2,3-dioxygenase-like lactoylglutathione lyase family enzyme